MRTHLHTHQHASAVRWFSLLAIVTGTFVSTAPSVRAALILGTGDSALLGGDLTDPEDDGAPDANVNYNAIFDASIEPNFGPPEAAFNVFDNLTGGSDNKWCCNAPVQWVEADFLTFTGKITLTHFTITSGNDSPLRDPAIWRIQGSNDGVLYTDIFVNGGSSVFTARDQVVLFDAGNFAGLGFQGDFTLPVPYSIIRFQVDTHFGDGAGFQMGELEFFGYPAVPEPSTFSLVALGALAAGWRMRRKRRVNGEE